MAEIGNGTRTRTWCFTENNPEAVVPFVFDENTMKYLVYQLETAPTTGTPHFQGYLVWKNPQALTKCRSLNARISWRVANGTAQENTTYCSKEPRNAPTVVHGVMPEQGEGRGRARSRPRVAVIFFSKPTTLAFSSFVLVYFSFFIFLASFSLGSKFLI